MRARKGSENVESQDEGLDIYEYNESRISYGSFCGTGAKKLQFLLTSPSSTCALNIQHNANIL